MEGKLIKYQSLKTTVSSLEPKRWFHKLGFNRKLYFYEINLVYRFNDDNMLIEEFNITSRN